MDKKGYEKFFKDVAMRIEELIRTDKVLMQNMRSALKEFGAQEAQSCQYMKKLYDKAKKEGENFKVSSGMQIPDKYKSPMRAMLSKHKYIKDGYGQKCIGAYMPNLDDNPKERQRRNYVALAIIHDNMLPETEKVNYDILPFELAGRIWEFFSPYQVFDNDDQPWYGDKKPFLESAIMSIQINVAGKPETGGSATPAKIINIENFRGILADDVQAEIVQTGDSSSIHKQTIPKEKEKNIIWKILKIIGAIAALLTILHYLEWLEPIKAFIHNMLWPK